jgi:3-dehydroquinate dehydratase type I
VLKGRICLSTIINEDDDVGQLLDRICVKRPDLVEFRTDRLHRFSILEDIAQKKKFPAIITDKTKRGLKDRNVLLEATSAGFEFVDVDLFSDITGGELRKVRANGTELITSFHDSAATPSIDALRRVLSRAMKRGGNICKIVTTAKEPKDNLTILNFLEENSRKARLVSFAMGPIGIPSRILSPLFGSEFTFAALSEQSSTAPGQLSIDDLRHVWGLIGLQ